MFHNNRPSPLPYPTPPHPEIRRQQLRSIEEQAAGVHRPNEEEEGGSYNNAKLRVTKIATNVRNSTRFKSGESPATAKLEKLGRSFLDETAKRVGEAWARRNGEETET